MIPTQTFQGMYGLGDNMYQRAVVRHLGDIQLYTSWPQLYADLPNVECLRPITILRTQAKNILRPSHLWAARYRDKRTQRPQRVNRLGYGALGKPMLESMFDSVGIQPDIVNFTGPAVPELFSARPYVIVRPCTVRKEWFAGARNPDPAYLNRATMRLREEGYTVICIADIDGVDETAAGPLPASDIQYINGELVIEEVMQLVAHAHGLIGGVGWIAPFAVAYNVPLLLVYGGWGEANGPQRIFDRRMNTRMIVQAKPDRFCMCDDRHHNCDKTITNFEGYLDTFVQRVHARTAHLATGSRDRILSGGVPESGVQP